VNLEGILAAMARRAGSLGRRLAGIPRAGICLLSLAGVVLVGLIDYLTGYEASLSLFYLAPVSVASWYAGSRQGAAVALASCVSWMLADLAAGNQYSHVLIAVWNGIIRFGVFLSTSILLTVLQGSLRRQRELARRDSLTGLYNRRAFEDRLEHDLALARRREGPVAVAYLDLDDFKAVNDTLGHAEGDRMLGTIGGVLLASLRQTDTAARLGGDEFALLLPDTDRSGARKAVEGIVRDLEGAIDQFSVKVSISAGVVILMHSDRSAADAIALADSLMYGVKRRGKDDVVFEEI
jgi:diguanylate cyclase (GGDEF)-like protein